MELTHYRTLGRSGLRVSPLSLGTMTFGQDWGSSWGATPEDSMTILARYLDLGGNVLDTANMYTKGHSEKIIGDYIKSGARRRDSLVISTKFSGNMYPGDPNGGGASRKTIIESLENSLRRLQTDYIDLYWMHAFDDLTPIEETMAALHDMVRTGKVRYIAVSDTPAWKATQAQYIAYFRGWAPFIALQAEYSLTERTVEGELIPMAQELGLGVMPWSPLAGGVLSGRYTRANKGQQNGRHAQTELPERTYAIIDRLTEVAQQKETTPAAVALAWVISRPGVASAILGARTLAHLDDNLRSLSVELGDADIAYLNEVSEPALSFPMPLLRKSYIIKQAGTTVNGRASVVSPLLPQNQSELH